MVWGKMISMSQLAAIFNIAFVLLTILIELKMAPSSSAASCYLLYKVFHVGNCPHWWSMQWAIDSRVVPTFYNRLGIENRFLRIIALIEVSSMPKSNCDCYRTDRRCWSYKRFDTSWRLRKKYLETFSYTVPKKCIFKGFSTWFPFANFTRSIT